jgi:L-2-hydroxyglutarate oxidase LhgO
VAHAGIYYRPGSLKAELCTRGRRLLEDYCAEHGVPFDACGKLVVAVDADEIVRLDALERTARQNSVPGLRRVGSSEIRELEPHAAGLVALHSPATAITDFAAVAETMASELLAGGADVRLSAAVTTVRRVPRGVLVVSRGEALRVDRLVVCAGLQADRVSRWVDGEADPHIVPFRGEYLTVRPEKRSFVRGMVYPVPDPRYPFLGVHFTRRVSGELEVGPNAVLALRREGYGRYDVTAADVRELLASPGFWRMARRHWRTGVKEVGGSLSLRAFMRAAQQLRPRDRRRGRGAGRCRGPRAGRRARRQPPRRLPHHRVGLRHVHPQRAVAGRDLEPGDRRARRRPRARFLAGQSSASPRACRASPVIRARATTRMTRE